jgi:signal peptidase I
LGFGGRAGGLLWAVVAALLLRACVVEPVRLSDDSMAPFLSEGDVAVVSKLHYGLRVPGAGALLVEWAGPAKGDLVVVVSVGDPPLSLMRRISAVPGDRVGLPGGEERELGPGEFFVLAEQEDEVGVMDSRRFGPVHRRSIIGKVTHTWATKNPSTEAGSRVESAQSRWRVLQPVL